VAGNSLRSRVLLILAAALLVFFAATVAVLEWSLGASLARARDEVLEAQLLAMIAVAEPVEDTGLGLPEPPDGRMLTPGSGLYAEIRDGAGQVVWRSPSALGLVLELPAAAGPGVRDSWTQARAGASGLALSSLVIQWEFDDGHVEPYRFVVAQDQETWLAQRRAFRLGLVGWFGLLAAATLALLAFVLRRVMRPLGRIEQEIREMETARRDQLSGGWPEELRGVASNLNALLRRERDRQRRYQESLANLAHSLKTPMAALRTLLPGEGTAGTGDVEAIRSELGRMDRIIGWQLRRAAAAGAAGRVGLAPVPVAPIARDLATILDKVYRGREIGCEIDVPEALCFRGDEGDLQEMLGNLLDNAWKYGRRTVRVSAARGEPGMITLRVEDDGPGLEPERAEQALARGARLDESHPGQGIGLAVARELATAYGGSISVERSSLGGAAIVLRLPGG
jgi:two-component system sensor histidine kinase PhoQ